MDKMLGVMLDCSRNAVLKTDTIKKFAEIISKMGYNTIMLYTEDTYEVDNQPLFGHLRGRFSKDEIKEIDSYCKKCGIEIIPCIQTLAHLEHMFKWSETYEKINDCDNILLAGSDDTYKLIDDMISTISQCFSSRKIHIGMDEAYRVGTGKYQELNGIHDRFDVINNHLHKVCEITDKYGLKPMIWSDMFCKLAFDISSQYDDVDVTKICEKAKLPENIALVYWDYYSKDYERYESNIKTNKLFGKDVYFAGGAWAWKGFAPDNKFSMETTEPAIKACRDYGVSNVFFTVWGDDTAECSPFAVLPALMYGAERFNGNDDLDSIKAKFKQIVGCDFDSFMLFDKLDAPGGKHQENPSKYLLYNDLFMGIRDHRCSIGDNEYYKNLASEISKVNEKGDFTELFEVYSALADVLSVKAELGIKTRAAYLKEDKKALTCILKEYELYMEKLEVFYNAHRNRWYKHNKPHGFEIQDVRLGGLMQRAKNCRLRLEDFISGKISEIPELKEPVIEEDNGYPHWTKIVTANLVGW